MGLARTCLCAPLLAAAMLCISMFAEPARALTVTFDYGLEFTAAKIRAGKAPFDLSKNVQLSGTLEVGLSDEEKNATVLANSFVIGWDGGVYDSGAASDAIFSEKIDLNGTKQNIFRFQDRSKHNDLDQYAFDLLRLDVIFSSKGESEGSSFASLENATKNKFELRFKNGSDKATYSGYIAFLEPRGGISTQQQTISTVPLPSSAASLLGGFALVWALRILRRRG